MFVTIKILFFVLLGFVHAEFYEDRRCSCICPKVDIGANNSRGLKSFYQDNHVTPEECNCNDMVVPRIANKFNGSLVTYCLQCECRFETRNTTVVLFVVLSLLVIISMLVVYMICLNLLQNILRQQRNVEMQRRIGNEEQFMGLLNASHLDSSDDEN